MDDGGKTLRQPIAQLTTRDSQKKEKEVTKKDARKKRHLSQEKDSIEWHNEFSIVNHKNREKTITKIVRSFFLFFCFGSFT